MPTKSDLEAQLTLLEIENNYLANQLKMLGVVVPSSTEPHPSHIPSLSPDVVNKMTPLRQGLSMSVSDDPTKSIVMDMYGCNRSIYIHASNGRGFLFPIEDVVALALARNFFNDTVPVSNAKPVGNQLYFVSRIESNDEQNTDEL